MKKLILVAASIIIAVPIYFLFELNKNIDVKHQELSYNTTLDAKNGYSYIELSKDSLNNSMHDYISYTKVPYMKSSWSWSGFQFKIDFKLKQCEFLYLLERPESAPDVFQIEILDLINIQYQDSNTVTFDIKSSRFGVIKCLFFRETFNKIRMLVKINDHESNQLILLRDNDQVEHIDNL
jgi:hypothetical protein